MRRKLLVCYVPGLDLRRVSESTTPAIARLLRTFPPLVIRTIPDTELVPTLLSGVYPDQNMIWQVSLDVARQRTLIQRLLDLLPGLVSTTAQCVRQQFNPEFDLATIPPRRRRNFVQHRFKYTRRAADPELLKAFNGHETIFGALGGYSRYRFTSDFAALERIAQEALSSSLRFELIEMYALDLYQHWHLDNDEGMGEALARTDRFVERLIEGCSDSGQTLVLLSDHGQEPVVGTIPLLNQLRTSGVPQSDYSYYCELACCRLWFHTESARETILKMLKTLPKCRPLHYRDMHEYEIRFDDDRFGEYYVMADAGYIFFPHDFYHPIANLYLGLFGNSQRSRIENPVHRGNHGYLPDNPSEKGFLVLADPTVKSDCDSMALIDFAPTMLSYLGADVPLHMTGRCVVS
jgi:hypothetical protein